MKTFLQGLLVLAGGVGGSQADLTRLDLLDNGGFEIAPKKLPGETFERVPWWRPMVWRGGDWEGALRGWPSVAGKGGLPAVDGGQLALREVGIWLTQPVAGWEPMSGLIEVSGRVLGDGRLVIRGGDGAIFEVNLEGDINQWREFIWTPPSNGKPLQPRFEVALGRGDLSDARFDDVRVKVPLVQSTKAQLDEEVADFVVDLLDGLLDLGRDRFGPKETSFWVGLHDVDTGKLMRAPIPRVGLTPMHGYLLRAVNAGLGGRSGKSGLRLVERLDEVVADFLEFCIQPDTHLPRRYDPVADVPLDDDPLEVALYLRYLIDLGGGAGFGSALGRSVNPKDHLSVELRDRAFEVAVEMGRALLKYAVLPDGKVAALVRPRDGWISLSVVHLRRLDVPAQLVRLAALLRQSGLYPELQSELIAAAREAVLVVEYDNFWPGTWKTIDPGFDDSYGHIGARSQTMMAAWPEEPAFGRLALSGRKKYTVLWNDALAFGGNIAADQVRCWKILSELAALTPQAPESKRLPELLRAALRLHFKGEQTSRGAWIDVTIVDFDPATNLPVGDVVGLPQNQLSGLGLARHGGAGLDNQETRAFFATLLAAAKLNYLGPFGLADRQRSSGGGIRVLPGLLAWL